MRIAFVLLLTAAVAVTAADFQAIHGFEPHFVPPAGAGFVSIKDAPYNAKGDGVSDDTAAFKAAIEADAPRTIWIPAGTYLIGDQLRYGKAADKKKRTLLIGEKRSTTVIKLKANAPGFGNAGTPKAFIHTRQQDQQGEQNFFMYVQHLTIEIGSGNPGAIGLNFHTNNTGSVKDVTVRASDPVNGRGHTGIACDDYWFGPGNVRFAAVRGFATGVRIGSAHNHTTLEHLTIDDCGTGISNGNNIVSARDVRIRGTPTGVANSGLMALIDLDSQGSGGPAVSNAGSLLAVNLTSAQHTFAISGGGASLPVGAVAHFTSSAPSALWAPPASQPTTLGLPVEESPEYQYPAASSWTVITGDDVGAALQTAIDAGATDVLFNGGQINQQVILRGNLRRIMGAGVRAFNVGTGGAPPFRLENGVAAAVIIERLYENATNAIATVEHASARTLAVRHGSGSYRNTAAAVGAKLFLESVTGDGRILMQGVRAWLRDVNTEKGGDQLPNIRIDGGTAWILGHKTEDYATKIAAVNGAQVELLGGTYRQNWDAADGVNALLDGNPLFLVENARATFCYGSWANSAANPNFKIQVRERRGTETRNAVHTSFGGTFGGGAALFTAAAPASDTTPPAAPTGFTATPSP